MKKRLVLLALMSTLVFTLTGCGEEEVVIPDTVEEISVSVNTSVKSPLDMTKEELKTLTPAEIKEMIETYLPDYRAVYGIDADRVMEDNDWMQLRDLIYYQLYGEIIDTPLEEAKAAIDFSQPDKIVGHDGSYLDPNWIYYAPTKEYFDTLSYYEFAQYMNNLLIYSGYELTEGEDFTKMDDDSLKQIKEKTIEEMAVEWGSVEIPTVNELKEQQESSSVEIEIFYDEDGNPVDADGNPIELPEESDEEDVDADTDDAGDEDTETDEKDK